MGECVLRVELVGLLQIPKLVLVASPYIVQNTIDERFSANWFQDDLSNEQLLVTRDEPKQNTSLRVSLSQRNTMLI